MVKSINNVSDFIEFFLGGPIEHRQELLKLTSYGVGGKTKIEGILIELVALNFVEGYGFEFYTQAEAVFKFDEVFIKVIDNPTSWLNQDAFSESFINFPEERILQVNPVVKTVVAYES